MAAANLILGEEDERRLTAVLRKLCEDAKSRAVFLMDREGRLLAAAGETAGVDTTSLAALTAGSIAATGSLAQLLGEKEFNALSHEGETETLHISVAGREGILVVRFDQRSSLGLVRLRVKRAALEIARAFQEMDQRGASRGQAAFQADFSQITDADIDNLFTS